MGAEAGGIANAMNFHPHRMNKPPDGEKKRVLLQSLSAMILPP
jgi:hypothetical protein